MLTHSKGVIVERTLLVVKFEIISVVEKASYQHLQQLTITLLLRDDSVEYVKCGVWKVWSVENGKCRKCGV